MWKSVESFWFFSFGICPSHIAHLSDKHNTNAIHFSMSIQHVLRDSFWAGKKHQLEFQWWATSKFMEQPENTARQFFWPKKPIRNFEWVFTITWLSTIYFFQKKQTTNTMCMLHWSLIEWEKFQPKLRRGNGWK